MLHVLLCHSVPPDNIPLGDKCKASSPIPLGWLAPWVQPSHCLMHADSRRLRGKIWYHLHLIFISGGTWTVSLLKAITGRGLARAVGKVFMAIWGIKKNTPERFEVHEGIWGLAPASPRPQKVSEIKKSDFIFSPSHWTRLASWCVRPSFHFFGAWQICLD